MKKNLFITALLLFFGIHLKHAQQTKKTESQRDSKLKYSSPGNISAKDYTESNHASGMKGNSNMKAAKLENKKMKVYYRSEKVNRRQYINSHSATD
jgi:hypothetical protein